MRHVEHRPPMVFAICHVPQLFQQDVSKTMVLRVAEQRIRSVRH